MTERSRKNFKAIFQRLSEKGQVNVAGAIGVSESTISRMAKQLQQTADMLAVLGLKVVPEEHECHPPEYIESIKNLAQLYLNTSSKPPTVEEPALKWGEDD